MQEVLDYRIEQEHPLQEGEDRVSKKLLALMTELGELANELPQTFKFWSNKKNDYKKALGEYVDTVHFTLSIGLALDVTFDEILEKDISTCTTIDKQFISAFFHASVLPNFLESRKTKVVYYEQLLVDILGLGQMLGFTWEQIEHAYLSKNKINHERQNNGY
jgi:dimeric dUTPase (all-alpha-NTP-PPase superfamily)